MTISKMFSKIIFSLIICIFCSSTCFAISALPISNMNCHDLIVKTNTILSLAKKNIYCSEPIFESMTAGQKTFSCYINRQNFYDVNGMVMLYENLSGKTTAINILCDINDKTRFIQSVLVLSSMMIACGLTVNEIDQLIEASEPLNITTRYGHVWSQNRYYTLIIGKGAIGNDSFLISLFAQDSIK